MTIAVDLGRKATKQQYSCHEFVPGTCHKLHVHDCIVKIIDTLPLIQVGQSSATGKFMKTLSSSLLLRTLPRNNVLLSAYWVIFHALVIVCQTNLLGTHSECQMVWIQIRTHILSVLIWIQTVCKDISR